MLLIVWASQVYGQVQNLQSPPCPTTLTLNSSNYPTIPSGSYEAEMWINAVDTEIASMANVTFTAGDFITLNPTFEADASSGSTVFEALIGICQHNLTEDRVDVFPEGELTIQNSPNPFSRQTSITFTLTKDAPVTLLVYDSMGRQIATLLDAEPITTGTHELTFDGTDYPSGVYYYTIQAGAFFGTKKMTLVR